VETRNTSEAEAAATPIPIEVSTLFTAISLC
jgi:hypothetical protein